ncbi:MAG: phosphotransferase enzyme family protein [Verrucomicrobiota bacterium]
MSEPADILRAHYAQRCQGELFLEAAKGGGVNSQNYLVRLGSADAAPKFVLKSEALAGSATKWKDRLLFQQRVAQCEPLVPATIPADLGALGLEQAGIVCRLLEFRTGDVFSGSQPELISAAQGLAQLHSHIRSLPGGSPVSPLYDHLTPDESAKVLSALDGPLGTTPFGQQVKHLMTTVLPPVTVAVEEIERSSFLPVDWVHRDFHPGNALFAQGRLTAILDLDSLATDFRMQAVAFAASRFAGYDLEKLWAFLAAYHAIDPLTAMELKSVPGFIRREALRRLNWIIRVNVLQGEDLWRGDLEKQAGILNKVKQLDAAFDQAHGALLKTITRQPAISPSGKP